MSLHHTTDELEKNVREFFTRMSKLVEDENSTTANDLGETTRAV
jgi:hypothetical protein